MSHRTLRWLTVLVPLLFLAAVDVARHQLWPQLLHTLWGGLLVLAIVGTSTWLFARAIFDYIARAERRILEQNVRLQEVSETTERQAAQLRALHEAGLALGSDLALETVLRRVVELAMELADAHYGALAVVDERGGIVRFLTLGLTPEERARLGEPPSGRGLLGQIFTDATPIRVDDIIHDSRSVGYPPGHPPMHTFLGVPIVRRGRTFGNLYLTDKQGPNGPAPFTEDDESTVAMFAGQAGAAMENARLLDQLQGLAAVAERERIARELHDSLAQVLGYIRLRAAAAHDAERQGDRSAVDEALTQIADVAGEAYADVREAILGLRSGAGERGLVDALAKYVARYREQTGIAVDLEIGDQVEEVRLAPGIEIQFVRIVQEALANVRKHARTARARVSLQLIRGPGGPRLSALVGDEGRGFDLTRSAGTAHYGLAIMRERAEGVGGSLTVETAPGRGTRVTTVMPIETGPVVETEPSGLAGEAELGGLAADAVGANEAADKTALRAPRVAVAPEPRRPDAGHLRIEPIEGGANGSADGKATPASVSQAAGSAARGSGPHDVRAAWAAETEATPRSGALEGS
ncbi:MAG: GAF domain-containing sensor histidine kinase [Chloroflexi bacterium]|nr:GAF domain-containing sensor histidine kinase [Chloroflexota bacterium]